MAVYKAMGEEVEYGFALFARQDGELSQIVESAGFGAGDLVAKAGEIAGGVTNKRDNRYHLPGGAMLYVDLSHPEFATAECADAFEVVEQSRSGERLLAAASRALEADESFQHKYPGIERVGVFKHNADFAGHPFGTHENYCIASSLDNATLEAFLLPFLVSRAAVCGSGGLVVDPVEPEPFRFTLSPRAQFVDVPINTGATDRRPMILDRSEAHADSRRYRRLQLSGGDATRCDVSTLLRFGTTAIVLAMIEDGFAPEWFPGLEVARPVHALLAVADDTDFLGSVALRDGRRMTALELQRVYLAAAERYAAETGLEACGGERAKAVLAEWERVLGVLERGQWAELFGVLDWPTKRLLMERRVNGLGANASDRDIARAVRAEDLSFTSVDTTGSVFELLRQRNRIECLATDTQLLSPPPQRTRAVVRDAALQLWPDEVDALGWDKIEVRIPGIQRHRRATVPVPLPDPMIADAEALQHLAEHSDVTILQALGRQSPQLLVGAAAQCPTAEARTMLRGELIALLETMPDQVEYLEAMFVLGQAALAAMAYEIDFAGGRITKERIAFAQDAFERSGCPERLGPELRTAETRVKRLLGETYAGRTDDRLMRVANRGDESTEVVRNSVLQHLEYQVKIIQETIEALATAARNAEVPPERSDGGPDLRQ